MNANIYLQRAKDIVTKELAKHPIDAYLFGSRAKGTATRHSDIDIALLPKVSMPVSLVSHLKEIFEESTIPYEVDVVDLSRTSEKFRQKVLQEGILWKDSSKNV